MRIIAAGPQSRPARRGTFGTVVTMTGLALGPAVTLGWGRFAYSLLLPEMRVQLHWTYAWAGAANSANSAGYLLGALVAAPMARRFGVNRSFIAGIAVANLAMLLSAWSQGLWLLMLLRVAAGAAAAVTYVLGTTVTVAFAVHHQQRASQLLGAYFAGPGVGIAVSGLVVPTVLQLASPVWGWRIGWLVLGLLGLVAMGLTAAVTRQIPDSPVAPYRAGSFRMLRGMEPTVVGYFLFGTGYIAYMTFIVAYLRDHGFTAGPIAAFWTTLGVAGVLTGVAWPPILRRLRRGLGPAAIILIVAVGAAIPLLEDSSGASYLSAMLFGSFMSVITAVVAVARVHVRPERLTSAMAALTVAFAVGQFVGPVLSGLVSDGRGGIRLGLTVSFTALVGGAGACLLQRAAGQEMNGDTSPS